MKIAVRELSKSFQDAGRTLEILAPLTFEFPSPGSTAILGRSGIGKSTLLHLLGGLDKPTTGSIYFDDVDISALDSDGRAAFRAAKVGFIFQFHHLLPEFSALENIAMPLVIGGWGKRRAEDRAAELLQRVRLGDRATHRPSQLSGGEQQRIAIARALAATPAAVLADEPTGSLDVSTAAEICDLMLEVNRESNGTLIVVTHNRELAETMDHVLEMQAGGVLVPLRG